MISVYYARDILSNSTSRYTKNRPKFFLKVQKRTFAREFRKRVDGLLSKLIVRGKRRHHGFCLMRKGSKQFSVEGFAQIACLITPNCPVLVCFFATPAFFWREEMGGGISGFVLLVGTPPSRVDVVSVVLDGNVRKRNWRQDVFVQILLRDILKYEQKLFFSLFDKKWGKWNCILTKTKLRNLILTIRNLIFGYMDNSVDNSEERSVENSVEFSATDFGNS